jgi:hypothetical protein
MSSWRENKKNFTRISVKYRRLQWVEYMARMGKTNNARRILVEKSVGKDLIGRPRRGMGAWM